MATKRTSPRIKSSHQSAEKRAPKPAKPAREPIAPSERRPATRKATPRPEGKAGPSAASEESRALAVEIAIAAIEKKAVGLEILDVAGRVDYTDFLVLMTGRSDRHVAALAQGIEEALRTKKNKRAIAIEGTQQARWVLMDFGDVVVHVFLEDARSLYDLEGLWADAHRLPLPAGAEERG